MLLTKYGGAFMGPVARLMGVIFNALYNLFSNFGIESIAVSVIVFTVLIRLLMFPLSVKQTRSSKIQEYLQPEFNKINRKYKGKKDQESLLAQQQETQELQKKYGISMTSGCLTSLIQFPIFMGLYYVIQNIPAYVTKVHDMYAGIAEAIIRTPGSYSYISKFAEANKLSRITSEVTKYATSMDAAYLSSKAGKANVNAVIDILGKCNSSLFDKLSSHFGGEVASQISQNKGTIMHVNDFIFGINLTETPGWHLSVLMLIPIASLVFQFLSMIVMPMSATGDAQQDAQMKSMRRMTFIMPIFSFIITVNVPAGLGLYWATSALISFLITYFTNLYYKHKDMSVIVEKQRRKAEKKNAKKSASGKKSWSDKVQEAATGQSQQEEKVKKQQGISRYSSMNLKNYHSSSSYTPDHGNALDNQTAGKNGEQIYRKGSISSRANTVKRFNEGKKE